MSLQDAIASAVGYLVLGGAAGCAIGIGIRTGVDSTRHWFWYAACLVKFRRKQQDVQPRQPLITSHIQQPGPFRKRIDAITRRGSFVKCHKRCDGDNPCGLSKGHTFPYCICDGAPSNCVCFGSD